MDDRNKLVLLLKNTGSIKLKLDVRNYPTALFAPND
jgi:hypothetical protein